MDQVLRNLVSNAIKFSPTDGHVTIRVFFCPQLVERDTTRLSHASESYDYDHDHEPLSGRTEKGSTKSRGGGDHHKTETISTKTAKRVGGIIEKLIAVANPLGGPSHHAMSAPMDYSPTGTKPNSKSNSNRLPHLRPLDRPIGSVAIDDDGIVSPAVSMTGGGVVLPSIKHRSNSHPSQHHPHPHHNRDDSSSGYHSQQSTDEVGMSAIQKILQGERVEGNLIIVVTDSGPGISEANQKKLFRGVIQFDPEKNQGGGGSGFGLFISKGIVDLHQGSISVFSAGEGQGCSFILSMPMTRAAVTSTNINEPVTLSSTLTNKGHGNVNSISVNRDKVLVGHAVLDSITLPPLTNPPAPSIAPNISITPRAEGNNEIVSTSGNDQSRRRSTLVGMGLAFSSKLVHRKSSNFNSSTPRIDASATPRATSRATPRQERKYGLLTLSPRVKKYRLLIVDDSGLSRKMLCKAMRAAGHECEEAADGLMALNKVIDRLAAVENGSGHDGGNGIGSGKMAMYDAILMDTNMPVQSPRTYHYYILNR